MDTELRELLERLHDKYNRPEFIECDPISVLCGACRPGDRGIFRRHDRLG